MWTIDPIDPRGRSRAPLVLQRPRRPSECIAGGGWRGDSRPGCWCSFDTAVPAAAAAANATRTQQLKGRAFVFRRRPRLCFSETTRILGSPTPRHRCGRWMRARVGACTCLRFQSVVHVAVASPFLSSDRPTSLCSVHAWPHLAVSRLQTLSEFDYFMQHPCAESRSPSTV